MKRVFQSMHSRLLLAACLSAMVVIPLHAQQSQSERRWLAPLDEADRAPLQRLVGHGPSDFSDEIEWHNVEQPPTWQDMRDRIVVIQSWTSAQQHGRDALVSIQQAVSEFSDIDVKLIALHTPEGAEDAAAYLDKAGIDMAIAVDPVGAFCDALGVYRHPVNLVIDRHGAVRYVGLTKEGIKAAINALIDEVYDPARCPGARSATSLGGKSFPAFSGSVGRARDLRGQQAPPLHVEHWLTEKPDANDKLVVLAFWATWCGPCIQSIPRLNQIAESHTADVAVIGVSNEAKERIEPGLSRRNITLDSFKYSVGCDSNGTMIGAVGVQGIPHAIVMCSDWIVRWQGHPQSLNDAVLMELIKANNVAQVESAGRWLVSR